MEKSSTLAVAPNGGKCRGWSCN